MIKVLHIVSTMGYGGVSLSLMEYYKRIDRTKIHFEFVSHGKYEDYHSDIEAMGGKVHYVERTRDIGLLRYLIKIYQIIKQGKYDIIQIHTNYNIGVVALVARFAGVKIRIAHVRGTLITDKVILRFLPILKWLIRVNCNSFFACSNECAEFYYGRKDFILIPNAVDIYKYQNVERREIEQLRNEFGIDAKTTIVGHVGRFSAEKNHDFILKIAELMQKTDPNYLFVLLGDGPLKEKINKDLQDKCLKNVILTGQRGDVNVFMNLFDIFILPSTSEGLPNTVLQAQAASCFCIVSDRVTDQVDMGLGLVSKLSIEEADKWVDELKKNNKRNRPSHETVREKIIHQGFEINNSTSFLSNIYSNLTGCSDHESIY